MNYEELAKIILGLHTDTPDRIAEAFHIDDNMTASEMEEKITTVAESGFNTSLQDIISKDLFDKVIQKAIKEKEADREKFDMWINGLDTHLYYNGSNVSNWEELEEEIELEKKERRAA